MWLDTSKNWNELSQKEKIHSGFERASAHNKSIARKATLTENTKIFENFIEFCIANDIYLHLVVPPASRYFRNVLDSKYKEAFYNMVTPHLDQLTIVDLFDDPTYSDEDYNDMDHLSDSGAIKMTKKILDILLYNY